MAAAGDAQVAQFDAQGNVLAVAGDKTGRAVALALRQKNPNILFVIARSNNLNVVVYEAGFKNGAFTDTPLDVYWLAIDPKYVADKRKKGVQHDKEELNFIEKTMAYGVKAEPGAVKGEYNVKLVALPKRIPILYIDKDGVPRARMLINGKMANLTGVYIDVTERSWNPKPKVNFVELSGTSCEDGSLVVERIVEA